MTGQAPLFQIALRVEQDIFVARQLGREVAAAVGLDRQDQVRLATALSEVGRQMLNCPGGAEVAFITAWPRQALTVEVAGRCDPTELAEQVGLAGRLVDNLEVTEREAATVVRMSRRLPASAGPLTPQRVDQLRAELAELVPGSALDELAVQNQQLLTALDEVRAQRDELARLNAELEETNRGEVARYTQLSGELEETNRGVVALYAELDAANARERAASESKTRFLANVSHELRAPVTAIIGLVRLLADTSSDPLTAEQQRQVELIRGSAVDLLSLVNDLLDLAKAESGRLEPSWAPVDLRDVFGQLRGTLRALAGAAPVELVVEEPPVATWHTDESMLTQVLRNLLTNGLKFTDEGEVRLTATVRPGGVLTIDVVDTGIGIPEAELERIFEEFYQVPGTRKARLPGTGLGLPYARQLAALLGGELTVRSAAGRGSTFTLVLPEAPPPSPLAAP